jgi:hypothetical protein
LSRKKNNYLEESAYIPPSVEKGRLSQLYILIPAAINKSQVPSAAKGVLREYVGKRVFVEERVINR